VPPFLIGTDLQATGEILRVVEGERNGNFYGRRFIRDCAQLPASFRSQCGAGQAFQHNDAGWLGWVGQGSNPGMGITPNLWNAVLPAGQAPWSVQASWSMPLAPRGQRLVHADGAGQRAARYPDRDVADASVPRLLALRPGGWRLRAQRLEPTPPLAVPRLPVRRPRPGRQIGRGRQVYAGRAAASAPAAERHRLAAIADPELGTLPSPACRSAAP